MTALQNVQSTVDRVVQAWIDAIGGVTGIVTAPLASNRTPASATKDAAKSAVQDTYADFLDGVVFIPTVVVIHFMASGDNDKSIPRRLGEGTMLGVVLYGGIFALRGVLR